MTAISIAVDRREPLALPAGLERLLTRLAAFRRLRRYPGMRRKRASHAMRWLGATVAHRL